MSLVSFREARPVDIARQVASQAGFFVENIISVPAWYLMIRAIGLSPGKPLQHLAEREWNASR